MKWLSLILVLSAFNAYAQEVVCPKEKITTLNELEKKLEICAEVDFEEDAWRISNMLKAYDKSFDCMKKVAYEVFDKYYKKSNKTTKEHFDKYINAVMDISYDITRESDSVRGVRRDEVFALKTTGYAHFMVQDIIGEYIRTIYEECGEAYQFEQEFAYEKNF